MKICIPAVTVAVLLSGVLAVCSLAAPVPTTQKPKLIAKFPTDHQQSILTLVFSPDGKTLASAGMDTMVRLWDVASRKNTAILKGHTDFVGAVAFSPDGKTLVSGSGGYGQDTTVRFWDVASAKNTTTLKCNTWTNGLRFSPDGRTLVFGMSDGAVRLLDLKTNKERIIKQLGRRIAIRDLAFTRHGKLLALGQVLHPAPYLIVFDVATNKKTEIHPELSFGPLFRFFSPDYTTVAAGFPDGTVRLWEVATGKHLGMYEQPGQVTSLAYRPDSKILAVCHYCRVDPGKFESGPIRLLDARTCKELAALKTDKKVGGPLAFSPDGNLLAVCDDDSNICLWDVRAIDAPGK